MSKEPTDELRQRAEKNLSFPSERTDLENISVGEIKQLVHELEVHQVELEMQNEELRRAQYELEESRLKYFDLFDLAPVGYLTMDDMGMIKEVNLTATRMLGVQHARLINSVFLHWVDENFRDVWHAFLSAFRENHSPSSCELKVRQNDSGVVYIHLEAMKVPDGGLIRINFIDVTKQKETEEKLRKALDERETLLGEVHHRVKNNLAVINSLLNLQMGKTRQEEVKTFVKECQSRIRSMAIIHETLYKAKDFSRLRLREYISGLANSLLNAYEVSSNRVRLELDFAKDITLPISSTVPFGLVLNELLSNSLKYAFPQDTMV